LENGVLLIVLRDEEVEDALSFSEEKKDEIPIVIEKDIQKFKYT
jgi:hypothetical protein